ncbi:hypothetical protein PQR39_25750 [Paraburkholderia sediminicola]|uniref:hypothetical protein n=1 Tax=Paraburkholderia sediminicola TaxID=458836 RepID=UPI0038BBCB6D
MNRTWDSFDPASTPVADTDTVVGYQTVAGVKKEVRYSKAQLSGMVTFATFAAIANPASPCLVTVTADETAGGGESLYYWNGNVLVPVALASGIQVEVPDYPALRAYTGTAKSVRVTGYYVSSAPLGFAGTFVADDSDTTSLDDGGIVIENSAGRRFKRIYDNVNVMAAWYGITIATADIGPYFAKFPTNCYVWFGPGMYTVLTYPTEAQFKNRFYRGVNTVWRCNGSLAGTMPNGVDLIPAFTWSFETATQATDSSGGNIGDMMTAGLSPIEGIGIIGNSMTQGIGFAMGNSGTNVYFTRPKNFSVQNFGVGFQYLRSMHNCFLTGLENVVLKSNGTNLICDNTNLENPNAPGAYNSGENFYFKSCYFGGASIVGTNVVRAQLCTFDNCSFDYNVKMGTFLHSNVKLKNCYIEGTPSASAANGTTGSWFDVFGVTTLDVDSGTNIYMLNGTSTEMNSWDVFNCNPQGFGKPAVRCNATIFSSPQRYKPLCSNGTYLVTGRTLRCNGGNFPSIVGEGMNLFPDARISADMSLYPTNQNCTIGTVGSPVQPNSGSTKALRLLAGSTTVGASVTLPKTKVVPGEEIYVQFVDLADQVTLAAKTLAIRYYTADGVLIPATTWGSGQYNQTVPMNAALSNWDQRLYSHLVPAGADYALISFSVGPKISAGDGGSWFIGTIYLWQ